MIRNLISRIFMVLFFIISLFSIFKIAYTNFLPGKFFWPLLTVVVILNIVFYILVFKRRTTKPTLIISDLIMILASVGLVFGSLKITELRTFLDQNLANKKYVIYNVIVNKNAGAKSMNDLRGAEIFTYEEPVKEITNQKLIDVTADYIPGSNLVFKDDLDTVMNRVNKLIGTSAIVNNGTYESYISVNEEYEGEIKIVGEIKVEASEKVEEETDIISGTIAEKPFLLYISGIDTRTDSMPTRSLSDVNILAAVNPKTKKITLVNIPRDSYVQIHGTTGLKDKLTHAGSRGGIYLSETTIEDLIGLKIDRHIRVNFNFLTDLVDNIGGITVYSDADRTITTLHGKCKIKPGNNDVNGKCALGFARERKSLKDGDRKRGQNQEQVIEKILEKISKDKSLIKNYNSLLTALSGSFDTNLTTDDITALVRMQLNDMSSWTVTSYDVDGKGTMSKTASYPNRNLYVYIVNNNSVADAKAKLEATLKN